MPRTKYMDRAKSITGKQVKINPDPIMELIKGRIECNHVPIADVADALGVAVPTAYVKLRRPGNQWPLQEIYAMCHLLAITDDELRQRVSVKYRCA